MATSLERNISGYDHSDCRNFVADLNLGLFASQVGGLILTFTDICPENTLLFETSAEQEMEYASSEEVVDAKMTLELDSTDGIVAGPLD